MRVTVLGVGGAFSDLFYHSNYIVELPGGYRLLIDAGTTLRYSLPKAGYTADAVNAIALTHFHSDHVGGLEELAQRCRYIYKCTPSIYVMPDQRELLKSMFALHGVIPEFYFTVKEAAAETFMCQTGECGYWLEYYSTVGLHAQVTSNYMLGLRRVSNTGKVTRILFTGDIGNLQASPLAHIVAQPETIAIFHDCNTNPVPSESHPGLNQMADFYVKEYRSKIYLTHYGDNIVECRGNIRDMGFKLAEQGKTLAW